jgi:hypothetical protein
MGGSSTGKLHEFASIRWGDASVSVNVVVNFQASQGNARRLLLLLREGRDLSKKAEGCESFDLFQRQDDPHKFMFSNVGHRSKPITRTWRKTSSPVVTSGS